MRQTFRFAAVLVLAFSAVGMAVAKPFTYELPAETAQLRPGAGQDVAQNNCMACHSADYVSMQPPKKGKPFWEAEVTKMIKTYKAPISDGDAKVIADYLASAY